MMLIHEECPFTWIQVQHRNLDVPGKPEKGKNVAIASFSPHLDSFPSTIPQRLESLYHGSVA
jgi:hypothetical protein